ncbi:YeeE/YedE family protein [Leptospira wolffii]|uniref:YeeE/YedE family protein n=1 Tax=Leptospira wolffii TaxID=409998 RepID=UPI0012EB6007|nr:YeeE/YedE family protein [Leptospira wolffii]
MSPLLIETNVSQEERKKRLGYYGFGLIAFSILSFSYLLHIREGYGKDYSFSALTGGALGFIMQRSRFCFFCNFKDFILRKETEGILSILSALTVSTIGYGAIFGAWIPSPETGYLPPNAFISPVHIHLLLGGFAFGLGMSFSGSCISGHLYRIGEGSLGSWFALLGSGIGFILGFLSWNFFYLEWVAEAPIVWLPKHFGYAGSLLVCLGIFFFLAVWVARKGSGSKNAFYYAPFPANLLERRWPAWVGGIGVGIVSLLYYFRVRPIGVTSEIGRLSRDFGNLLGVIPTRLEGLDSIAGCATTGEVSHLFTINAVFTLSLILGSFGSAIGAGQFRLNIGEAPFVKSLFSLSGGILLGWGAMVSVGCTFGTFFSGVSAQSLSGFVFAAGLIPGILSGLALLKTKS